MNFPTGKEMVGVMMATTMQDVLGTEVTAVEMMSKPLIALPVNVLNQLGFRIWDLIFNTVSKISKGRYVILNC